jgi:phosphoribosylglycinamide formyltransferase-1
VTVPNPRCRIAVLVSGNGTNLQAFIDATASGELAADVAVVVSNRGDAYALERARRAGIAARCIPHGDFPDRESFDRAVADALAAHSPDLVVLAGFMRILSGWFVDRHEGRVLNIHPALLPKYPGLDTHRRVLEAGDPLHGSTVHFVTEELDGGPRILAGRTAIRPDDTPEGLERRIQSIEHRIYPQAAQWFAEGRLEYRDKAAWLDGNRLDEPVVIDFD